VTKAFQQLELPTVDEPDLDEDAGEVHKEIPYDLFLDYCAEDDTNDNDPSLFSGSLHDFSFKPIRNHGLDRCRFHQYVPETDFDDDIRNAIQSNWVYSDS
jgi:hypothetical protein